MKTISIALGAAALSVCVAAAQMDVALGPDGTVHFGETALSPVKFLRGWRGAAVKGGYTLEKPGAARFSILDGNAKVMDASVCLEQLEGGKVRIGYRFKALADVETESTGCAFSLPAEFAEGREWRAADRRGKFAPHKDGGITLGHGRLGSFAFHLPGAAVMIDSPGGADYLVQDERKWGGGYTVRFGELKKRKFAKGDEAAFSIIASADAPLAAKSRTPLEISAGNGWIPVETRRDIEPGSALDFSRICHADAPAGKYGWLKNSGGRFEFEKLPGKQQKFYGVNLCGTANFPDRALAETLVKRFRRTGYNSIRLHHHDNGAVRGSADGTSLDPVNMERLDYFVAAAIREGLYITTDIYVSRGNSVKWRHIGIDRDGTVGIQHFKALCAVYDPAFENWAAFARNFMEHVNPHTGRRYADEPAMPLVSLVNEGGFFMGWNNGVKDDERVVASWKKWLAAKRAADPSFAPGIPDDRLPENFRNPGTHPFVAQWTGELESAMVERMKTFLRSIGCKALLTDGNCGPHYSALQRAAAAYDYVDDHFYVDHPAFPEKPWSLPSTCPNKNPLLGNGRIQPSGTAFARIEGKPFTVTEWNFSGPGRYRAVGGILAGAMGALQDWDGMWRFAYAHSSDNLGDRDLRSPGYFDLSSDPLALAGERACLCLFMRGDLVPFTAGASLLHTAETASRTDNSFPAAPQWCDEAWRMRAGSCLAAEDAPRGVRVLKREDASPDGLADLAAKRSALSIDRKRGAFSIATPRTCGGFAPEGEIEAGLLRAAVSGAPATVWASSLDSAPLASSRRMLLVHLTDVQGEGTKFSDETMTTLLKWGKRPLARDGAAEISLRADAPERLSVHELAMDGKRRRRLPSKVSGGVFRFGASVAGPDGARMFYEIAED